LYSTLFPYTTLFRSQGGVWRFWISDFGFWIAEFRTKESLPCSGGSKGSVDSVLNSGRGPADWLCPAQPVQAAHSPPIRMRSCPEDRKSTRLNSSHVK